MIEIRNLYKRYHNHHGSDWVLRNINLTIPMGVSVGLVGRNGAGKSTLLRLIAGMDVPERGSIHRGCRVSWPIGLSGGFQGSMTGRQNVKFVARVHGGRQNVEDIIERVRDFAEIGEAFDEPIKTYSSGMRARLNFGLSLAFDFDVYLSDEATSVGDRAFKAKASKAFKDKVGKASLIMVSHGEGMLKELCQAGVYLQNGRATWYDDIKDAIAAYHAEADEVRKQRGEKVGQATSGKPQQRPGASQEEQHSQQSKTKKQLEAQQAQADSSMQEGETQEELESLVARRRADLEVAKAAFEHAKAMQLVEVDLKPYQRRFRKANKQLQQAEERLSSHSGPRDAGADSQPGVNQD
ncbi:ABC transporter ATP-binding protein [Halomonas elongata]|uniref:ABC-type transport system ATP-binding protein n=1 Tax=Halomonas elongata (strain ATCC 33173 / DSM 2581 / NBRC 15536 / NCIMB 2198 / 1H9) TaxID=768066 RepID=E1VC07_HALED|nr:ABC transporter ATP-binding protein [Halomonas elongata]WBF19549.1 ATP-binding cassette domain-containing protein [Halomonas elongata]WPU48413.1 ATP-binding cassette domain-containing protein [Halomonas elongata DSM 2581]CBV42277.1 ABC-type transport system ATP-binding protein [Halomonas elongata DSM 2581]